MNRIFTYGTLKEGQCRSHVLGDQRPLGRFHTFQNYKLFHNGNYPCMVDPKKFNDGYPVYGEVYEITNDKILDIIDEIEGVPHLYKRRIITVKNMHASFECYAYIYQHDTSDMKESGRCWPAGDAHYWEIHGKKLVFEKDGYRLSEVRIVEKEKSLSPKFKTYPELCNWCADNIEIFGGGKVDSLRWHELLKPFIVDTLLLQD